MLLHAAKSANVNSSNGIVSLQPVWKLPLMTYLVSSSPAARMAAWPSKGREDAPVKLAARYAAPFQFCIRKPG